MTNLTALGRLIEFGELYAVVLGGLGAAVSFGRGLRALKLRQLGWFACAAACCVASVLAANGVATGLWQ